MENEPSGLSPKFFSRIVPAFSLSAPGSTNRFVRRLLRPEAATAETTTATIQAASTTQRKRIIVRARASMTSRASLPEVSGG
jgi:hypothetical protein